MSRKVVLDDASAGRAALARLFQNPAAAVTEAVKMQPSVPDSAELVAIARAAKLQRAEKANSIRMKRLQR
jgi:O-acetyl-ADP-ribose deacetylase (regulator of RNase III)